MTSNLRLLDASDQAALVHTGEVSPLELVDSAIERINALNPPLNAVIYERFEEAREEAVKIPSSLPFAGVPLLIKDLGCPAARDPYHQGSLALKKAGIVADHDCAIVRRFRAAGFIIVGRTNVPEFGVVSDTQNKAYGVTANPWNPAFTPGGSSGGSAAAVASGMVPVAHGNDGGGSIRIPASHCGLVGLKPTRGRVSHAPDSGDPMFGHVTSGVLTRSVRDTGRILDLLAGPEPGDPSVAPPPAGTFSEAVSRTSGRLRIGYVSQPPGSRWTTHPDCVSAVATAATVLEGLGHTVEEAHPAAMFEEQYWAKWFDALSPTVTSVIEWAREMDPNHDTEFDPITLHWAERGKSMSAPDLADTLDWLDRFRRRVASWWSEGFDLLLCPVFITPPPVLGSFWAYPEGIQDSVDILRFTPQFNSTGQPSISLPTLWTGQNLPVGVQLVAAFGKEELLLSVAAEFEVARPWYARYPVAKSGDPLETAS